MESKLKRMNRRGFLDFVGRGGALLASTPLWARVAGFMGLGAWSVSSSAASSEKASAKFGGDGTLWVWGRNDKGQLGHGRWGTAQSSPVQVSGSWTQVSAGAEHMAAVRIDGTLWVWGSNENNQLGQPGGGYFGVPIQIAGSWTQVSAGLDYTIARRTDGSVEGWGMQNNPDLFAAHLAAGPWTQVARGTDHTLAIKPDATLWAWGANSFGQLGTSDTVDRVQPKQVAGSWMQVTAGDQISAALR